MKTKEMKEGWLTKKDAAEYLRVSTKTINSYRRKGIVQAYKAGGKVLFKKSELFKAISPEPKPV